MSRDRSKQCHNLLRNRVPRAGGNKKHLKRAFREKKKEMIKWAGTLCAQSQSYWARNESAPSSRAAKGRPDQPIDHCSLVHGGILILLLWIILKHFEVMLPEHNIVKTFLFICGVIEI